MSDEPKNMSFEVQCPCCEAAITIDRATGAVLHHREKGGDKRSESIGDILSGLTAKKESAEKLFEQEMSAVKDRGRLLDEKLQEALKRARETKDEKFIRPIDLE
jgi:hypothetical protein